MRISVIIPCHNAGRWIGAALRSVAAQEHRAHEIIVIDDASSDDSLAQIAAAGVPVRLSRVEARNAAVARNAGIEAASGDWIAFLDADDIWYPNHLARAVALLAGTDDVAFMANHDWIGLHDEPLPVPVEFQCKLVAPRSGMDVEEFMLLCGQGFHFGHSTVLYRLDRVRALGMFDPAQRRRHDIDLWLRMIADRTFTYDTVKSAGYRENTPGSLSKDEIECDYFNLRALVKNLERIPSPHYRKYLAREARRAMGRAFVDGGAEHFAAIRDLAWVHLPLNYRVLYRGALLWPGLARSLIRARRRLVIPQASASKSPEPAVP
jgi:glycosyltransferase involved in cell wall biosynthesis